eukprot:2252347-Pyramimonas_sp.AAC.1
MEGGGRAAEAALLCIHGGGVQADGQQPHLRILARDRQVGNRPSARSRPGLFPALDDDPGLFPALDDDPGLFPALDDDPGLFPALDDDRCQKPLTTTLNLD